MEIERGSQMIPLTIAPSVTAISTQVALGCVRCSVSVEPSSAALVDALQSAANEAVAGKDAQIISDFPRIKDARDFYRRARKEPGRYRSSSEQLLRRVAGGKGLYFINNVVDINNLISIRSHFSVGSYDLGRLTPPLSFTIGAAGAAYQGIGKGSINLESLPIFEDANGPFGSPTSDSERALITTETKELLMIIISFSGVYGLDKILDDSVGYLERFARACNVARSIIVPDPGR